MLKLCCRLKKLEVECESRRAQGLVEYILVFILSAVVMYAFATRFDYNKLKNFSLHGFFRNNNRTEIILPPMTD